MKTLRRLWQDEQAATATEYGIIAAILAVGLIGVLIAFRDKLKAMFGRAGDALDQ